MTYQFIAQHQQEFPVQRMCRVLEVSQSGYYAWKRREPSLRVVANEQLATRICPAHKASHHIYGSRRIQAELLAKARSVWTETGGSSDASARNLFTASSTSHGDDR